MASSTFALGALLLLFSLIITIEAQSVGVCYGRNGNNLPSDQEVVALYKSNGIGRMRIYDPNPSTLEALRGSGIELIVDVPVDRVQALAADPSAAASWVRDNVAAYSPDVSFKYIAVGNEIHPGEPAAASVLPAMRNVREAVAAAGLEGTVKVSTAIDTTLLRAPSYPPSEGVYDDAGYVGPIVSFLKSTGAPILINVYPYFAHVHDNVPLSYALFTDPGVTVPDGQYGYQNLFDAMVDTQYAALEKVGGSGVNIVVSESGWPSEGGAAASPENAGTYYKNLVAHVKQGTPRKAGQAVETYLFAMFDENTKAAGIEQHFGVFSPDKAPKYQLSFN